MGKIYEIQFEIETKCMLNCIHCSSLEGRELSGIKYQEDDILNMIGLFDGDTYITFTGGEPLLNNKILSLIRKLDSKRISIYTSGNLNDFKPIDKILAYKLKEYGVSECYFSIYSILYSAHDQFTNTSGSLKNTLESIENLNKYGIEVKAHVVLTRQNIDYIYDVIKFCERHEFKEVRILKLAQAGRAKSNWNILNIPIEDQNIKLKEINQNRNNFNINITIAGYPEIYPCRSFAGAKGCQAGTNLLYVDAIGDIYPCACTKSNKKKYKICNIKELDKIKRYIDDMDNFHCWEKCLGSI